MNIIYEVAPKRIVAQLFVVLSACATACSPAPKGASDAGGVKGDMALVNGSQSDGASSEDAGAGTITFVAGTAVATLAGSEIAGSKEGIGDAAQFNNPTGIALDGSGNLFVAEYDGARVRKVTKAGATSTITSQKGFVEPFGVTFVSAEELLVQTDDNNAGVKSASSGTLWNVPVGTGVATMLVGGLGRPRGIAHLTANTVVVSDRTLQTISLLDQANGTLTPLAGADGNNGYVDGNGASARFDGPVGAAILPDSSILVADSNNHCLRQVTKEGTVTTFAGNGTKGMADGPRAAARFDRPVALAIDSAGVVYISDQGDNHRIRRVTLKGDVETVAGNGVAGFADGAGDLAEFYGQEGIAVDPDGKILYVADGNSGDASMHHRIRKITLP